MGLFLKVLTFIEKLHPYYYGPIAWLAKAGIPCSSGANGVGSIPANSDAQYVPSFRRWRFEMKLSPPFFYNESKGVGFG